LIRAFFWVLAAGLLAAVTHLAYVLFLPSYEMRQVIRDSAAAAGVNTFSVLQPDDQQRILKESAGLAVAGVCAFDLTGGTLVFDAVMPQATWSFTIYGEDGEDAYSINDAQAGTNQFHLIASKAPGLLQMLTGGTGESTVPNDGWTAAIPSQSGLVVAWVSLADRALRPGYAAVLGQSRCHIEPRS
jgi:uncharacterized membrane protein